ncbi:MAG: DNA-protecting protein DprA [Peptococcaceae bacterium]|nr:DNA-protecting protein DprA [Peptococcaceae bacterium]
MGLEKERVYRAAILSITGIGSQRLRQLIASFGSAEHAWEAETDLFAGFENTPWIKEFFQHRKRIDPITIELSLRKNGISLVMLGEENYPFLLAECPDAPPLLYYKGNLEPKKEGLAIVGSRHATPYGKAAASYLARSIAETDYVVISGLARGIDSAAHKGALEADGITWAFLAGGLDVIYPPENVGLAQTIMQKGALISEYPPGVPPEAGLFPARNRLISGSSRGVIVVEAAERSGSMITVDFALEQGREVFAVPGPIFSKQSRGTHQLLKMGAKLVSDKEDVFSELLFAPQWNKTGEFAGEISNDKRETKQPGKKNEILEILTDVPLHIDRLTAQCSLSPQEIALSLLELQLSGEIVQLPGQNYVLQRK